VGVKMLLEAGSYYSEHYADKLPDWAQIHVHIPIWMSLSIIGGLLALSVVLSLAFPQKDSATA
jgi:hypothetical protein